MINDLKGKTALILSRHGEIDIEIARAIAAEGCNLVLAFGQSDGESIARRMESEFDIEVTWLPIDDRNALWQEDLLRRAGPLGLAINFVDGCAGQSGKDGQSGWDAATEELRWQLRMIGLLCGVMKGGVIVNYIKPLDQSSKDEVDLAVLHSGLIAFVETISKQIASDGPLITNVFAERSGAAAARRAQVARLYNASPLAIALAGVSEPNRDGRAAEIVRLLTSDHSGLLSGATLKIDARKSAAIQEW